MHLLNQTELDVINAVLRCGGITTVKDTWECYGPEKGKVLVTAFREEEKVEFEVGVAYDEKEPGLLKWVAKQL